MIDEELAQLLRPLVRQRTLLTLKQAEAPALPVLGSHFGGRPYLEAGEAWPICPTCGLALGLICQINMAEDAPEMPPDVALLTFFYCHECMPLALPSDPPGEWMVRTYSTPAIEKAVPVEEPYRGAPTYGQSRSRGATSGYEMFNVRPCSVTGTSGLSLPDIESLSLWAPEAAQRLEAHTRQDEWDLYYAVTEELIGEQELATSVGGYPSWIQGDATPSCPDCSHTMALLVQIESEAEADLMWGDAGSAYLFHCPMHPQRIDFLWQCH